jgi:uncharacterized protein (DUF362 family)
MYCNQPLEKQKGTKVKVVGITKVSIPSTAHPIVPYHVVLLQDEFGNRMPRKTMRSYKIGDPFEIKPSTTDSAVVIQKLKYCLEEDFTEAVQKLRGVDINPPDKVFIKVSCIESTSQQAMSTSPQLLEQAIVWLKGKGVRDIVVGEHAILDTAMEAAKKSGILNVCWNHQVEFVDLSKAEFVEKIVGNLPFNIAKIAIERKLLNIPVLKTHVQFGVAGALENLARLLDKNSQIKVQDHQETLPMIIHACKPFLNIGDASIGMHGDGPLLGEPAFLRMMLLSRDAVALDRVFAEVGMLLAPSYVVEATQKKIEVVGYEIDAVKTPLKKADNPSPHPFITFIDGGMNPWCYHSAVRACKKLVGAGVAPLSIAMGKHLTREMVEGKGRIVLYGRDSISRAKSLGITPVAELPEEMPELQKMAILKSMLEDPHKKRVGITDMFKLKMEEFMQR